MLKLALGSLLAAAVAAPLTAQQSVRLRLDPQSRVTVHGTSNMHKWDCTSSSFTATIDVPSASARELGKAVDSLAVSIPVTSLGCGNRDMNRNLRKAMHADKHATIDFRMTSYVARPTSTTATPAGSYEATVEGTLTINGITKPVTVKATVTTDGKGLVRAEGSTDLRTTTFGVKRVSALLGTMRTGENVSIVLTLIASQP